MLRCVIESCGAIDCDEQRCAGAELPVDHERVTALLCRCPARLWSSSKTARAIALARALRRAAAAPVGNDMSARQGILEIRASVQLDSPDAILAQAAQMQVQLRTNVMPTGNPTRMTEAERATVLGWRAEGAPR